MCNWCIIDVLEFFNIPPTTLSTTQIHPSDNTLPITLTTEIHHFNNTFLITSTTLIHQLSINCSFLSPIPVDSTHPELHWRLPSMNRLVSRTIPAITVVFYPDDPTMIPEIMPIQSALHDLRYYSIDGNWTLLSICVGRWVRLNVFEIENFTIHLPALLSSIRHW